MKVFFTSVLVKHTEQWNKPPGTGAQGLPAATHESMDGADLTGNHKVEGRACRDHLLQ